MGLKLSSLFSKKKSKKPKRVQYSPRTEQALYDARRNGPLIYPPLSSIPKEEPKRSLRPDGRLIYEPVHMDTELDENNREYENSRYQSSSYFGNYYNQYDNGTFAVLSPHRMNDCHIFRI